MADLIADTHHHPCYDQEAHHFFARMHVAVAPKCNIQCKYCNRKYDCVNESRPGVTSELLTPEAASQKVLAVGSLMKNVTVVGIAGPGDPLANPENTFRTFSLLRKQAPDMQLCLSTNGLVLNDYIDEISQLKINHVTITVNAVDPHISEEIYQFVRWRNKTLHGLEAAERLLQNQLEGIEKLIQRGILVKINSVLIPDVNDRHMVEISKQMKSMGVFVHNIMPLLIADGSIYHKADMAPASPALLAEVQRQSQPEAPLMRHCRQCRADAVGTLGQDRNIDLTEERLATLAQSYSIEERAQALANIDEKVANRKRIIEGQGLNAKLHQMTDLSPFFAAVASSGKGMINEHFGHAKEFQIYEISQNGIHYMTTRKIDPFCSETESCVDEDRLLNIAKSLQDCKYLVCQNIGNEPKLFFESKQIKTITTQGLIEQELFRLAEKERELDLMENPQR